MIVVDDGSLAANAAIARRAGARYLALGEPRGLNAARNAGIAAAEGELLAFIDDDVQLHPGWLEGLLAAAHTHPEVDVFTGPIIARFEGRAARRHTCGREGPPITHTDSGGGERDVPRAWGANMAIRRSALVAGRPLRPPSAALLGPETRRSGSSGTCAAGGRIRFVGAAALDHLPGAARRKTARADAAAAHARGREAREFDEHEPRAPSLLRELRACSRAAFGTRCGVAARTRPVMAAHSVGRISRALEARADRPARGDERDDFLSGESGTVGEGAGTCCARLSTGRSARVAGQQARIWWPRSPPRAPGAGALRCESRRTRRSTPGR